MNSSSPAGGTARSFTYDASGDIVTDSRAGGLVMSYRYDVEGRLSRASRSNAPTTQYGTYAYDAQNRLASRTVMSGSTTTTTLYVPDIFCACSRKPLRTFREHANDHIIAETATNGTTLREYIWLNDLPIGVVDNVNTATPVLYYVHTDHLGRPARMVNFGWTWVWDVIYSPFGGTAAIFDSTAKLDARFPGQWFQLESGLAYNWHRHYDASLGRYVQPDPIGYAGGRSLYGYAAQNPQAYIDPSGLDCYTVLHMTMCSTPSGMIFPVPRQPGFPNVLSPSEWLHHHYDVPRPIGGANPNDIMDSIICNPTPGDPNPATEEGTYNNAVVWNRDNPVTSYITYDIFTGKRLVVNMSNYTSYFHAGYVVRYVQGGFVHTEGEGNSWKQWGPDWAQELGNNYIWGRQMDSFIQNPKGKCRCKG